MQEKNEILEYCKALWEPGEVREIRAFDENERISYGYFDSPSAAAIVAKSLEKTHIVYITLNPVNPALLSRAKNRIRKAGKKDPQTGDKDIAFLKMQLVDCDPRRPAGISSTEEELQKAEKIAHEIIVEYGKPRIFGMSGNGYHLIYNHNAKEAEQLHKFLETLNAKYGQNGTEIDLKVYNPSRITKVLGTFARKGDNTTERPHRQSHVIEIHKTDSIVLNIPPLPPVPIIAPKKTASKNVAKTDFNVRAWLSEHGIIIKEEKPWEGSTALVLSECVFDPAHKGKDAMILLGPTGLLTYHCFHNSCEGKKWEDVRNQVGDPKQQPTCKYCGWAIEWEEVAGKWQAKNGDGTAHKCRIEKPVMKQEKPTKQIKIATPKTLEELMDKSFQAVKWAIPTILPEGTTILAGKPKMGKSAFALNAALAIAAGGKAFGTLDVEKGEVLYLALEDGERRMQGRIKEIMFAQQYPKGFFYACEWPKLDDGGIESLEEWLSKHEKTKMIVIDTFAKVRTMSKNDSVYDQDYKSVQGLKALTEKYRTAILIVHHTRKADASDALDLVSGSFGLSGGVDGVLVLKRDRGKSDAVLHITGRDVEEKEIALQFKFPVWQILGDAVEIRMSHDRKAIVTLLKGHTGDLSPKEIYEKLTVEEPSMTRASIKLLLLRMMREGLIKSEDGKYYYNFPDESAGG